MASKDPRLSLIEVTRLARAATLLQRAAHYNYHDEMRANRDHVTHIYFVDPAMVIWYCKPTESQNLSGFDNSHTSVADQHRVLTTSLLTLDFMFSDAKAGAAGLPVFLSPGHAEELHNKIDREIALSGEAEEVPSAAVLEVARRDLAEAISRLNLASAEGNIAKSAAIEKMFESVNAILAEPLSAGTFAQERFIDLIERGIIAQISQHEDMIADSQIDEIFGSPDLDRVEQWREWLTSQRTTDLKANLERDAETLASLERLNIEARGAENPQRFLFITSSAAIHNAMELWIAEPVSQTEKALRDSSRVSFARHPRQYIPLFNLNSALGRTRLEPDIFYNLKDAISDLATFATEFNRRAGDSVDEKEIDPSFVLESGQLNLSTLSDRALELRRNWSDAMKTAALLNVDALSRTSQKALNSAIARVERDLSSEQVNSALSDQIRLQTERMLKTNRAFAIRGRLLSSAGILRGQSSKARTHSPRLPLLFDVPLSEAVKEFAHERGQDVGGFGNLLDWLLTPSSRYHATLSDFEGLLQKLPDSEAYSLATAVVFRSRDWASTRYFAGSCIRSLGRRESRLYIEREMQYCRRVAQRLLFRSFPDFQELRHRWLRSLETYRDDIFVRARALSELAALELVCVFRAMEMESFKLDQSYARELLSDARKRIRLAMALHDSGKAKDAGKRPWLGLLEQLTTNTASALVQRNLLLGEALSDTDYDDASQTLEALRKLRRRAKVHDLSRLYEEGLVLVLGDNEAEIASAKRNIRQIAEAAKASTSLSGAAVDQAVLRWFIYHADDGLGDDLVSP